jgi:hypothetical protein
MAQCRLSSVWWGIAAHPSSHDWQRRLSQSLRLHSRRALRHLPLRGGCSPLLRPTLDSALSGCEVSGLHPPDSVLHLPFQSSRGLPSAPLHSSPASLQSSILPLHKAVFVVLFVALAEAIVWFAAYQKLNITGTPYCCPFPALVVGALVMQVLPLSLSRPSPCSSFSLHHDSSFVKPCRDVSCSLSVSVCSLASPPLFDFHLCRLWDRETEAPLDGVDRCLPHHSRLLLHWSPSPPNLPFSLTSPPATAFEVSNIISLDVHPNSSPKSAFPPSRSCCLTLLSQLQWDDVPLASGGRDVSLLDLPRPQLHHPVPLTRPPPPHSLPPLLSSPLQDLDRVPTVSQIGDVSEAL